MENKRKIHVYDRKFHCRLVAFKAKVKTLCKLGEKLLLNLHKALSGCKKERKRRDILKNNKKQYKNCLFFIVLYD